jgi:hypothetical protein
MRAGIPFPKGETTPYPVITTRFNDMALG